MRYGLKIRIVLGNIPFILLFIICSSKWLFEDVIGYPVIEVFFVLLSLCLMLVIHKTGINYINKGTQIWLPYVIAITGSLLLTLPGINLWGRAILVFCTIIFSLFCNNKTMDFYQICSFMVFLGVFHAVLIIVQFILKDSFNNIVFPLYKENSLLYASSYYRGGYYFGILDSPHEVSGIVGLALAIVLLRIIAFGRRHNIVEYIMMALLLIAFLLTQKKGVILCSGLSLFITLMFLHKGKKMQNRIMLIIVTCLVVIAGYYLVTQHSDLAIFHRLGAFADKMMNRENIGGERLNLYSIAIKEWKENKLTGIGWRQFKGLTKTKYDYIYAHEVNCDYLQFLCELGIVGFSLVMITIISNFVNTARICRNLEIFQTSKQELTVILCAIFIQIFTVIYAVIEIPFYDVWFFSVYVFSFIIINCYSNSLSHNNNTPAVI